MPLVDLVTGEELEIDDRYMGDERSAHHHLPYPDMGRETYVWIRP